MKVLVAFLRMLSRLPMGVLYFIADLLFPLVYHVARYRRKVVHSNLVRSFPEKSPEEIRAIERQFYRFFCDMMMETVRQGAISIEEISRRMTFSDYDELLDYLKNGQSVMLMMGHYCNWEWGLASDSVLPDGLSVYPIYQKLNNPVFDEYMLHNRNRLGGRCIEKNDLVRTMVRMRDGGACGIFAMISDQSPTKRFIRHRTAFLNQDTPVFLGTEQLARKYNYPVFFLDMEYLGRGRYHGRIVPIAMDPNACAEYEITNRFMELMEICIRRQPSYWLWTHKRWKHSNTPQT